MYCLSRSIVCTMNKMDSTMEFIYTYTILLSIPTYYTMDKYYGILLSIYIYVRMLSYYPSHPILPWTRWIVLWNPTVHLYIRTLSYVLSIPSYCTIDKMDSTMESKYPVISTLSYYPSHPIVPWTGWTVQ